MSSGKKGWIAIFLSNNMLVFELIIPTLKSRTHNTRPEYWTSSDIGLQILSNVQSLSWTHFVLRNFLKLKIRCNQHFWNRIDRQSSQGLFSCNIANSFIFWILLFWKIFYKYRYFKSDTTSFEQCKFLFLSSITNHWFMRNIWFYFSA